MKTKGKNQLIKRKCSLFSLQQCRINSVFKLFIQSRPYGNVLPSLLIFRTERHFVKQMTDSAAPDRLPFPSSVSLPAPSPAAPSTAAFSQSPSFLPSWKVVSSVKFSRRPSRLEAFACRIFLSLCYFFQLFKIGISIYEDI